MDLRALRYFIAVFETGSISAASKRCYIAQPSISSSLKQLEDTLGKPLFVRHTRGVAATEHGKELYPVAKQLLGQADAIKDLFRKQRAKHPYRLGLTMGLGADRMSHILKRFTSQNDSMELTLVPTDENCDARIINTDDVLEQEHFIPMWTERYSLTMPVSHPLSLKSKIQLHDLQDLPFIQRTPCEGWEQLRNKITEIGIQPDIRAKIHTIEYALGLVKAGVGCALIPDSTEVHGHGELVHKYIQGIDLSRRIGLAYKHDSELTRSLVDILKHSEYVNHKI